ncbi:MAG: class I SAM-dependent methyltransferase [Rhodothermales bacterium]
MNRFVPLALLIVLPFAVGCGGPSTGEAARPPISDSAAASVRAAGGAAADTSVYTYQTPSRDGTGKLYLGREISHVMGHRGAAWLERAERAELERPGAVVDSLDLAPDDVVADIGAGTGYFTFRIAGRVPEGGVYAVDIQPEMLAIIDERAAREGADNVEAVQGTISDPNLPEASVDLTLIVDAYHEFSHPREMMEGIVRSLRPGGRVVLVEYRGEDPSIPIKELHKMTEAQVRLELEAVGLRHVETKDFLPRQHFLVFVKPEG